MRVGRSLSECTAQSISPACSAASSSAVKKPFSSVPARRSARLTSPWVVMTRTSTSGAPSGARSRSRWLT
ncbi:MAG: hypothetical protein A2138_00810 [Deltaproteobacteria bacterium RBG_16_71_12]|nr:MAG: hypothetical protein A2138_00810 [Deltaproteobacteria bacterium RBG_16_71_12]